jgi:cell division protein FtsB
MPAVLSCLQSFSQLLRKIDWTPNRVWIAVFAFWLFMLSGVSQHLGFGSPGLVQFLRLNSLLGDRQTQASDIDTAITELETESSSLEKSRVVQEREIRKTMGYVGENEMIFDFSLSTSSALRR